MHNPSPFKKETSAGNAPAQNATPQPREDVVRGICSALVCQYDNIRAGSYLDDLTTRTSAIGELQHACAWADDPTNANPKRFQTGRSTPKDGRPSSWVLRSTPQVMASEFKPVLDGAHYRVNLNIRVNPEVLCELERVLSRVECSYKFGHFSNPQNALARHDSIVVYLLDRPSHSLLAELAALPGQFPRVTPLTVTNDGLIGERIVCNRQPAPGITMRRHANVHHVRHLLEALAKIDGELVEGIKRFHNLGQDISKISEGELAAVLRVAQQRGFEVRWGEQLAGFMLRKDHEPFVNCDPKRSFTSWNEVASSAPFHGAASAAEVEALFLGCIPRHAQADPEAIAALKNKIECLGPESSPSWRNFHKQLNGLASRELTPGVQMILEFHLQNPDAAGRISFDALDNLPDDDATTQAFPALNIHRCSSLGTSISVASHRMSRGRSVAISSEDIQQNLLGGMSAVMHDSLMPLLPNDASEALKVIYKAECAMRTALLCRPDMGTATGMTAALDFRFLAASHPIKQLFVDYPPDTDLQHLYLVTALRKWLEEHDRPKFTLKSDEIRKQLDTLRPPEQ